MFKNVEQKKGTLFVIISSRRTWYDFQRIPDHSTIVHFGHIWEGKYQMIFRFVFLFCLHVKDNNYIQF